MRSQATVLDYLRPSYTSEVNRDGDGCGDVRALTFVCKSNEGDESGDGCVKEAERKVSFLVSTPSHLTSLTVTSSVNRLNGSGDEDVINQPIKFLEKY